MSREDLGERVAVLEVRADQSDRRAEQSEKLVNTIASNVLGMQAEATQDRELMREILHLIAATHSKVERTNGNVERQAQDTARIAGHLETYLPQIHTTAQASAQAASRAAENTGRIPLVPVPVVTSAPTEKSGPAAKIARTIFRAPVAKILAVAALVLAFGAAAGLGFSVYQEWRAVMARMGGR